MSSARALEERVAQKFGFAGNVVRLTLPEGSVSVAVHVDEGEHQRRYEAEVGPITDRRDIAALWDLPFGISVPATSVPAWSTPRLTALGAAVKSESGSLTRMVQPPTRMSGALAVGRKFGSLLQRVGQLSAISPRGIVVQGAFDSDDAGLLDAALYRVGVMRNSAAGLETLSLPGPVRPYPSRFLWWVSELAYAELISIGRLTSPTLPPVDAQPSDARLSGPTPRRRLPQLRTSR